MRVAVVIVSRDDSRVHACLESVFRQAAPFAFHAVLVDNGSRLEHVAALRRRWGNEPRLRILEVQGNFSAAWNEGALSQAADVVARLDSDTVAHEGWLAGIVAPLERDATLAWTAGPVVGPRPFRSLTQRYIHFRTLGYQRRLEGSELPTDAVPSWNVAYRMTALRRVGGYDPWQRSSIDWDLHKRLTRAGARGRFVPDAVLTHDHPSRLRDFYRKEAWYRTGQYQMMLKYGLGPVRAAVTLPLAYAVLLGVWCLGAIDARWMDLAVVLTLLLASKQWITAGLEKDHTWWARPAFRFVEAFAAAHGLLRGVVRFGLRRRPLPTGA